MKKWHVEIEETAAWLHVFNVEADSEEEAQEKALTMAKKDKTFGSHAIFDIVTSEELNAPV